MNINYVRLGLINYREALEIQEKLNTLRRQDKIDDVLLLLEHNPVLTIGKHGNHANILLSQNDLVKNEVEIVETARGGDVTYHGAGQIVGYPIMDLNNIGKFVKTFVWEIEEVFIQLLREEYNIAAQREENKYTGVWVNDEKITAIGIAVKHGVTMHGFAFNVNTQLEHYKWINPCGITDKGVTSLQKLLGATQDFDKLNDQVLKYFCKVFNMQPISVDINSLISQKN